MAQTATGYSPQQMTQKTTVAAIDAHSSARMEGPAGGVPAALVRSVLVVVRLTVLLRVRVFRLRRGTPALGRQLTTWRTARSISQMPGNGQTSPPRP